jgi:hypothetical protein
MTAPFIRQHGPFFLDTDGGQVMLRGVNLGGDCKVPPGQGTDVPSDFSDHRTASFVGRPFPLAEADEHLGRIAHWGFNTLRLLTTWEAVEHAGPGQYDDAYLDYLAEVARKAGEHGLALFVDFHQDVWSRMSGGDGAPGWTFEAVGLDFTKFHAADAAHVMQARYDYASSERRQDAYPQMSWGSNYRLPANGIMWTLFWAGRVVTPDFKIDGVNVQDYLQDHYLGAVDQVARRLAAMPHVLGFDSLNEPSLGWAGQPFAYRHLAPSAANPERPRIGPALASLDAIAMARGLSVEVPVLTRDATGAAVPTTTQRFNPNRISIWRDGRSCPFEAAGLYRIEDGAAVATGADPLAAIDPSNDVYRPFFHQVANTIRRHQPGWTLFAEMDVFAHLAGRRFPAALPERTANASHWYDMAMLYLKRFDPANHRDAATGDAERGLAAIAARYRRQLGEFAEDSTEFPGGGAPTLIGEFGIPYDLSDGEAYARWAAGEREGVWDQHEAALTLMYDAMDALGLHSTQWNYTASNRNDLAVGDGWNQEDLSIYSRDQETGGGAIGDGGRAVPGFSRPYVRRAQGRLRSVRFDRGTRRFTAEIDADAAVGGVTDIYVPHAHYAGGFIVRCEGGPAEIAIDGAAQRVGLRVAKSAALWIEIVPAA